MADWKAWSHGVRKANKFWEKLESKFFFNLCKKWPAPGLVVFINDMTETLNQGTEETKGQHKEKQKTFLKVWRNYS